MSDAEPPETASGSPPGSTPPPDAELTAEFWGESERRGRRRGRSRRTETVTAGGDFFEFTQTDDTESDDPDAHRRLDSPDLSWSTRLTHRIANVPVEGWLTLVIVGTCVGFVVAQLGGSLLITDTTPAGGDMGAHVWGPAFMRDHLLPSLRLTGWSPDWYAGLPAFQFYMVPPMLAIAVLSYVLPYGIAFKLVAVSGVVTMPIAAWAFGRLTRLPFPAPALLAVGATAFLFDRSFSIYGGNLASTLAGEFAFSISLSLSLVYLGVVARGLRTGRHRGLAAVLLALVALCHVIPAIFAVVGTAALFLVHTGATAVWRRRARAAVIPGLVAVAVIAVVSVIPQVTGWGSPDGSPWLGGSVLVALAAVAGVSLLVWMFCAPGRTRWVWLATMAPVAGLLVAWWYWPFWSQRAYLNDMGWERKTNIATLLWNRGSQVAGEALDGGLVDSPPLQWVIGLAVVGLVLSLVNRRRAGVALALIAIIAALGVWGMPQGRLWNARLTPFYYLSLYLLAGIGIAEFGRLISSLVARDLARPVRWVRWATGVAATLVVLVLIGLPLRSLPGGTLDGPTYRWGPFSTTDSSFVPGWARWNFSGYEGKAAWPEYQALMATMTTVGQQEGCGRAMWEYEKDLDRYGTPMALMLLPFWTDGCIGSMEGLYFETSTTTPYHFLMQDQLSAAPSNAQRDLPYVAGAPSPGEFDKGIANLQLFGVRYYLATSAEMKALADDHPDLTEIATSGPWNVYEVADAPLVEGLTYDPIVVQGADVGGDVWLDLAVEWFIDPNARELFAAASGPDSWPRVDMSAALDGLTLGADVWGPQQAVAPATVSNIETDTDRVSFSVDRTGVPVLVKTSYFPNWDVSGAEGPWRVTPNLMVVVPTERQVSLTYGRSGPELIGWVVTGLGIVLLIGLWRWGRVKGVGPMWWFWPTWAHPDPPDGNVPLSTPPLGFEAPARPGSTPEPPRADPPVESDAIVDARLPGPATEQEVGPRPSGAGDTIWGYGTTQGSSAAPEES